MKSIFKIIAIMTVIAIGFAACGDTQNQDTPITVAAVTGVIAPATGAAPSTTANAEGNYTVHIVFWNTTDSTFQPFAVYTVWVTLVANRGFTFDGLNYASINRREAAIINNTGSAVRLSYTFPETGAIPPPPTPITTVDITGITAPVTGAVPVTTASGDGDFSVSVVSWNPNHNQFQAGIVYTAYVTLTANSGFTFTGLATATIGGAAATIFGNTGSSVTLSRTFAATSVLPLDMVRIPAGIFTMGSPAGEPGRVSTGTWAETQRQVTLTQGFYMGRFQVTRAQWYSVIGTTPWGAGSADNRALTHVSWHEAIVFANRLSMQAGLSPAYEMETTTAGVWSTDPAQWGSVPWSGDLRWNAVRVVAGSTGYRLPTEAQWEYAARAGTTTAFNDGVTNDWNDTAAVRLLGWFSGIPGGHHAMAVGQLRPNIWGLYDMHGNVWEWVWDWTGVYPTGPCTDPTGPITGTFRVTRGGSISNEANSLRSAARGADSPWSRFQENGFRLVRP